MNKKRLFFKKTAALLLCAVLLLPCSACFNSPEAKNPGNDTGQITDSPHSETRNEAFNDYVNRLFTETVTTDTIKMCIRDSQLSASVPGIPPRTGRPDDYGFAVFPVPYYSAACLCRND